MRAAGDRQFASLAGEVGYDSNRQAGLYGLKLDQ